MSGAHFHLTGCQSRTRAEVIGLVTAWEDARYRDHLRELELAMLVDGVDPDVIASVIEHAIEQYERGRAARKAQLEAELATASTFFRTADDGQAP